MVCERNHCRQISCVCVDARKLQSSNEHTVIRGGFLDLNSDQVHAQLSHHFSIFPLHKNRVPLSSPDWLLDTMKCASVNCSWTELTTTDPCVVCGRGVHHLCSNELYDGRSLSERFCSASCLYQWNTVTSPGPASVPIESDIRDLRNSISQDTVLSTSQASSSVPLSQQNDSTSQYPSDTSVVDLTVASTASSIISSSPSNSLVNAFGIPLEHAHF
ncbi:unnamed protein product [Phytophthora fragariaefolia]|uniref:Unnamed protein product n=1 Tax=Phytophthora fragariaefolia TaxID=1490495 RepID=A0A9W7CYG6_9STRA|nr:unnamed protein product [Phytophthora fragariaefolia]